MGFSSGCPMTANDSLSPPSRGLTSTFMRARFSAAGKAVARLRVPEPRADPRELFPPLEQELTGYTHYFEGRVLNAGAGDRDIRHLVAGELVNQDIPTGLHNANIDVFSPLHAIPFADGHFDAVICNAVLEHVQNPRAVIAEFRRVLRPGGILYLCVPFLQPEHLDPTDYQRYTLDGLTTLVGEHGFDVVEAGGLHSVYTTLAWISIELSRAMPGWRGWALRWLLLPWMCRQARDSTRYVPSLASAHRVIGRRRA
jgi:SAM-dependent methyltransferase